MCTHIPFYCGMSTCIILSNMSKETFKQTCLFVFPFLNEHDPKLMRPQLHRNTSNTQAYRKCRFSTRDTRAFHKSLEWSTLNSGTNDDATYPSSLNHPMSGPPSN